MKKMLTLTVLVAGLFAALLLIVACRRSSSGAIGATESKLDLEALFDPALSIEYLCPLS